MNTDCKGDVMTVEEMYSRFSSEWVLVNEPETAENLTVVRGKVLWHGRDKKDMHAVIATLPRPFRLAVLYTGEIRAGQALEYQLWRRGLAVHDSPA